MNAYASTGEHKSEDSYESSEVVAMPLGQKEELNQKRRGEDRNIREKGRREFLLWSKRMVMNIVAYFYR